jgi:predicted phage terminase large subunit-like protein
LNALIKQRALYEIDRAILFKQADRARSDFFTFFREFAWPVLEPATKYVDNWHIHTVCDHLQAITRGEINRLIINMPFRLLKSTLVSQAWPAWEWLNAPQTQWLSASFAKDLAIRDAVNSRRIIESSAYQDCWGNLFQMTSDQNVKSRYENTARGTRFVTSTESGATGFGGNRILVDDPLSALQADNEIARKDSIEWFKGTLSTRFNNPAEDAAVVVHQRLHENDLTGFLLREQQGVWEHLVLPMRYESKRTIFIGGIATEVQTVNVKTKINFCDPRVVEGELLCPNRLNEEAVKAMEVSIGAYHTAAQLQQHPDSRGGNVFARGHWKFYRALPQIEEKVISVDCTFKDTDGTDFVAIQVVGRTGSNKYLIKRLKERMGFGATVMAVRAMKALYPECVAILIEDKANGSAVIETIKNELPGVVAINPAGGKTARAYAIQPQHEAGNFWLPDPAIDPAIESFLGELSSFPNGTNDDEVDAWTQAINWYASRDRNMGIFNWYKQKSEQIDAQRNAAHG